MNNTRWSLFDLLMFNTTRQGFTIASKIGRKDSLSLAISISLKEEFPELISILKKISFYRNFFTKERAFFKYRCSLKKFMHFIN